MADFHSIDYKEYENWIAVVVGLAVTVKGLHDYCNQILNILQRDICQIAAINNLPDCNTNCSKRFRNSFVKWCDTCRAIKDELQRHNRHIGHWNHINWSKINSCDWKSDTTEIAKVFINKIPDSKNILEDMSALISLFRNSDKSCIGDQILIDALTVRNRYYAHYFELRLSEYEKHRCIDSLISLVKEQGIFVTASAKWAFEILKKVKHSSRISPDTFTDEATNIRVALLLNIHVLNIENLRNRQNLNCVVGQPHILPLGIEYIRQRIAAFEIPSRKTHPRTIRCYNNIAVQVFLTAIVIGLIGILFGISLKEQRGTWRKEECISMHFDEFGVSDWDFMYDVKNMFNNTVLERTWLKEVIEGKLERSEGGLLLTAGNGFGKSSVIAAMVCAGDDSVWFDLKKKVLSYHLCMYDVEMSKQPTVFIRNIAARLSMRYKYIYKTLRSDNTTDYFLFGTHCSKDPVGCFDRLVIRPLKQNKELFINEMLIILLDAADECEYPDGKKDIVSVLSHRLTHLPPQVKFLITSRDILSVKNKLSELQHLPMYLYSEQITEDLKTYVHLKTDDNKLLRARQRVQNLVKLANGSLLYLSMYLSSCQKNDWCSTDQIPSTLAQLYRTQFKRHFGISGEHFQLAKVYFEILAASKRPLTSEVLLNIANIPSHENDISINFFFKNKLRNFLYHSQTGYTVIHKSLKDFFLELNKESPFYIDIKKGHERLAVHLMKQLNKNNDDLIEIAFHIVRSGNESLEKGFILSAAQLKATAAENLLHTAAKTLNSYSSIGLLFQILGNYDMDTRDSRNETVAFLAASYGNFETLRWFLDNGADINFEKNRKEYKHLAKFDLVKECKYVYFCGYNLLEISAQNGHYLTLGMLLNKSVDLLNHVTSFGLTAFDLAAENGHEKILRYLIQLNGSLPTLHSLYKAAKNGHTHVVSYLLNKGITDACIPCNNSLYWISDDVQRAQQKSFVVETIFDIPQTVFYDDWRLIMCESALHAAVRNCFHDTIELLISQNISALNCFDRSGRTPIMSSVVFNCTSAFKLLVKNGANVEDKCEGYHNFSRSEILLNEREKTTYLENSCPSGSTLAHLLQKHKNFEIIKFLFENGFTDWGVPDDEGVTPLHYAHCNHDTLFLTLAMDERFQHLFNMSRSKNGSTPYHAAAYCKCLFGHLVHFWPRWLEPVENSLTFNHGIPDVKDNDGRGIMHYFFLGKKDLTPAVFIDIYLENNINMNSIDNFGRNFLHYAVSWGDIRIIRYILDKIPRKATEILLLQKDDDGRTPLQTAYSHLPAQKFDFRNDIRRLNLPDCRLDEIFSKLCDANYSNLLHEKELFNFHLISLYATMNISDVNVIDMIYIAANRSSFYSIQMLLMFYPKQFIRVMYDHQHLYNIFQLYRGVYLAYILLARDSVLVCNEPHTNNTFASLIMNYQNDFWPYYVDSNFLKQYLEGNDAYDLDTCFDKEGYNLLHRAAIGGNIYAIQYLIEKGMNVSVLSSSDETLIEIILQNALYKPTSLFPESLRKIKKLLEITFINVTLYHKTYVYALTEPGVLDYDSSSEYVLSKLNIQDQTNKKYWARKMCNTDRKNLSLVHLAAAKGLLKTLQIMYDIFGRSVIECRNYHSITPYYLAKVNDHFNIIEWLQTIDVQSRYPQKWLLPIIPYLFSVNFDPFISRPKNCRWSLMKEVNFLTKTNYVNCFGINTDLEKSTIYLPYHFTFRKKVIFNTFSQWIKMLRTFSYHAVNLKKMVHKSCYKEVNATICYKIIPEVGLQFRGATLASRMLYQSLRLFQSNHITQMASYMYMYNMTVTEHVEIPKVSSLYSTIFSGKLNYLKSLKMTERHYHDWSVSKLGHIETYGQMSSVRAEMEITHQNNFFVDTLFDYFSRFHFLMWRQRYMGFRNVYGFE